MRGEPMQLRLIPGATVEAQSDKAAGSEAGGAIRGDGRRSAGEAVTGAMSPLILTFSPETGEKGQHMAGREPMRGVRVLIARSLVV